MTQFDVAIVGGGPAGAATAIALACAGRSVILLERCAASAIRFGETLSPTVFPALVELGVWERFLAGGPASTHGIWSAWSEPRLAAHDFITSPYGPAWRVDRGRFDGMLRDAGTDAGARVEIGVESVNASRTDQGWRLEACRGAEVLSIGARMMVDATGRSASVARAAGVRWRPADRMIAVIGILSPKGAPQTPDDVLLIESVPAGWWYSSLLPDGELVAALLTDGDLIRSHHGGPAGAWDDALACSRFTSARAEGFSLRLLQTRSAGPGRLESAAGPGWMAVGDAASAVDPLSGAGIAKSLRDAILAARAIDQSLAGDSGATQGYAESVKNEYLLSLQTGASYYRAERRWPESPFWRRRQQIV